MTVTTSDLATIHAHRADATRTEPVPAVLIAIDLTQPVKDGPDWAAQARAMFNADAQKIADALQAALPGGTWTALLAEMLTRQGCLLRVPMPGVEVAR